MDLLLQRRLARPAPCRPACRPQIGLARPGPGRAAGSGRVSKATVAEAIETVQQCMEAFTSNNFDAVLDAAPDEVVDYLVEQRRAAGSKEPIQFQDILEAEARQAVQQHFTLDSYALRNLVYGSPAASVPLSSMLVTPTTFLQRCAVNSRSGEESVLTFALHLQDSLQPQYRGVQMSRRWMLRSITGESACTDLPDEPTPAEPPETIVQAQLAALRAGDIAGTYQFASPENKKAVGSVENFSELLMQPLYRPLLAHTKCRTLNRMQVSEVLYMELVHITGELREDAGLVAPTSMYLWIVSRQEEWSHMRDCWLTDAVHVFPIMQP